VCASSQTWTLWHSLCFLIARFDWICVRVWSKILDLHRWYISLFLQAFYEFSLETHVGLFPEHLPLFVALSEYEENRSVEVPWAGGRSRVYSFGKVQLSLIRVSISRWNGKVIFSVQIVCNPCETHFPFSSPLDTSCVFYPFHFCAILSSGTHVECMGPMQRVMNICCFGFIPPVWWNFFKGHSIPDLCFQLVHSSFKMDAESLIWSLCTFLFVLVSDVSFHDINFGLMTIDRQHFGSSFNFLWSSI